MCSICRLRSRFIAADGLLRKNLSGIERQVRRPPLSRSEKNWRREIDGRTEVGDVQTQNPSRSAELGGGFGIGMPLGRWLWCLAENRFAVDRAYRGRAVATTLATALTSA
jgi:hypothetical protein